MFRSPILYNIFASDQPNSPFTMVADYSDGKAILFTNTDSTIANQHLQNRFTLRPTPRRFAVSMYGI